NVISGTSREPISNRSASPDTHTRATTSIGTIAMAMPTNIVRFERLAYLSLLLGMIAYTLMNSTPQGDDLSDRALVFVLMVIGAIGAVLISGTARWRKNWMRWTYSGVLLIGVAVDCYSIPVALANGALVAPQIMLVMTDVLDLTCIALLFTA